MIDLPQPSPRSEIEIYRMWEIYKAVNARMAAGGEVLNLLVGEPTFPPPAIVRSAAETALAEGKIGYTEALGLQPLRRAIADLYRRRHRLDIPMSRIAVTIGSSSGFLLAFLAAFEAGQRVAVVEPCYPAYRGSLKAVNLEFYRIGVDASTGFAPTPAMIEALPADIAGLVLASPANPTGTLLSQSQLAGLYEACRKRKLWLIVDELYHGVTFDQPAETVLANGPDAVVVNGFSKFWGMTGWRVGWLVLPERLVHRVEALGGALQISAPALSQIAALAALTPEAEEEMQTRNALYRRNRDRLVAALPSMGLGGFAPPDGAFYIYTDIARFRRDSSDFCRQLLEDTGVVLAPGWDFDTREGGHYLRFSYCVEPHVLDTALERLGGWVKRQG